MPPKAKFTKEEIVEAALAIVREQGMEALTARALGGRLGSSSCPVFTVFQNMEEVQKETISAARALYKEYIGQGLKENPAFKGVGTQYILFAVQEPKLFQLLFMTEQENIPDFDHVLPLIDESYEEILLSIENGYKIGEESAKELYRHLWIYTHGIAALCATNMCRFTGEEIGRMMTQVFTSLLKNCSDYTGKMAKKEKNHD